MVKKVIKFFIILLIIAAASAFGWYMRGHSQKTYVLTAQKTPEPRPLEVYQIDKIIEKGIPSGDIIIGLKTKTERGFDTYLIEFWHDPGLNGVRKMTSGVINIPVNQGKYPIILMARGYVDQAIYESGMGTKNGSEYFASNGYITIAPDFLGYGGSEGESANIFETRFQTNTTFSGLIETIFSKNQQKIGQEIFEKWDGKNIFIWAHSNGGQISLSSLVETGRYIPATLWAPVSKPFPYSILYFTDESVDRGKFIRSELAKFEELYDVEKYNFDHYLNRITSPIQIHQGTADDAVPLEWSNEFSRILKQQGMVYDYFIYPGTDHNMKPDWNTVVERDLEFFKNNMIK